MEEKSTRTNQTFRLFVYGTLKRGFSNHARFCESASNIEEAAACGDLYDLPFGFPALVVSEKNIQTVGTTDYAFDAAEQHRMEDAGQFTIFDGPRAYGEVFTFDDPDERLPALDRLEGFDPEGHSLYRRVLIPVEVAAGGVLAWAYVIDRPVGTLLPTGRWPS